MKKVITSMLAICMMIMVGVAFVGCSDKSKATYLTDGQILKIVDNTVGEGEKLNIPFNHSIQNSVESEDNYILMLPIGADNPDRVRYFAKIGQAKSQYVEITNLQNGATLTKDNIINEEKFAEIKDSYTTKMEIIDMPKPTPSYNYYAIWRSITNNWAEVTTTSKYCYQEDGSNLHVWCDKVIDVVIHSDTVTPISFKINLESASKDFYALGNKGDSWEII